MTLACPHNAPVVARLFVGFEGEETTIINTVHLFCIAAAPGQKPANNPTVVFDGLEIRRGSPGLLADGARLERFPTPPSSATQSRQSRSSHAGSARVRQVNTRRRDSSAQHGAMALVLLLVVPSVARAESSQEVQIYLLSIQRLFEDLEYERALNQIHLAQQLPRGAEDEITLALYEGVIQCELGKEKEEQGLAAFKSALLLRQDAKLPVQVSPKVEKLFESVRQQVNLELAPLLAQREAERKKAEEALQPLPPVLPMVVAPDVVSVQAAPPRNLRRYSLVPAIAGGALVVAGGIAWGISRGDLNQLRNDDPRIATVEDMQRSVSRGRTWQTVGVSLLSVGAAGLAAATGMYVLGAPDKPVSIGVSTNGTSAVLHGRWP